MIAPSSLSAFSATNGVPRDGIAGAPPVGGPPPIQTVRAQSQAAPGRGGSTPQSASPQTPPSVVPGQILPRGSLLDLSV